MFDDIFLEIVPPGDTFDPVDHEDMSLIQHKVVNDSGWVRLLRRFQLLGQPPCATNSHWVPFGDGQPAGQFEQGLVGPCDANHTSDGGLSVRDTYFVTGADLGHRSAHAVNLYR